MGGDLQGTGQFPEWVPLLLIPLPGQVAVCCPWDCQIDPGLGGHNPTPRLSMNSALCDYLPGIQEFRAQPPYELRLGQGFLD